MMRDLYADNYPQRRLEVLLRAEGRCENTVDGQRCKNRLGTFKISHAHQPYFFTRSCSRSSSTCSSLGGRAVFQTPISCRNASWRSEGAAAFSSSKDCSRRVASSRRSSGGQPPTSRQMLDILGIIESPRILSV